MDEKEKDVTEFSLEEILKEFGENKEDAASAQTPEVSRGRGLTSVVPTPGGPLPDPTGGYSWQGVSVSDEARA